MEGISKHPEPCACNSVVTFAPLLHCRWLLNTLLMSTMAMETGHASKQALVQCLSALQTFLRAVQQDERAGSQS